MQKGSRRFIDSETLSRAIRIGDGNGVGNGNGDGVGDGVGRCW